MSTNPFAEFLDRYSDDPVLFVSEVLDIEPFDYQAELLNAVNQKVRRLSIKAGHGCENLLALVG